MNDALAVAEELRRLADRVEQLYAPVPTQLITPASEEKRRPTPQDYCERQALFDRWADMYKLERKRSGHLIKISIAFFASTHNLNASEITRWLPAEKPGREREHDVNSIPDINIRAALTRAIDRMEARQRQLLGNCQG